MLSHNVIQEKQDAGFENFEVAVVFTVALASVLLTVVGVVSLSNTITPNRIVIHHSAVPFPSDGSPVDLKAIMKSTNDEAMEYCIEDGTITSATTT